jgi:hypothetical protein
VVWQRDSRAQAEARTDRWKDQKDAIEGARWIREMKEKYNRGTDVGG